MGLGRNGSRFRGRAATPTDLFATATGMWWTYPMSDFGPEVDLSAVSQFFEILSQSAAISNIELDDIHFTNGGVASPPDQ